MQEEREEGIELVTVPHNGNHVEEVAHHATATGDRGNGDETNGETENEMAGETRT